MRQSFLASRERIKKDHACGFASCAQVDNLSPKFVAHQGEVAEQRVKQRVELAGVDVILVHRMLKNQVQVPKFVLMTDVAREYPGEPVRRLCKPLTRDFEGIGKISTHYIDLAASELPARAPQRGLFGRVGTKLRSECVRCHSYWAARSPVSDFAI